MNSVLSTALMGGLATPRDSKRSRINPTVSGCAAGLRISFCRQRVQTTETKGGGN